MRHRRKTLKLGRKSDHRQAMLTNLVCSLIEHNRVTTTVEKAKAARSVADKMVTLGKKGDQHHKRLALASLKQKDAVNKLFTEIAPRFKERSGGYTRVIRLTQRKGDAAHIAILEWVENFAPATTTTEDSKAADKTKTEEKE